MPEILIAVLIGVLALTNVHAYLETTLERPFTTEAPHEQEEYTTPKPHDKCVDQKCPRYYNPLCVSVNGTLITVPTPCHLKNHKRCSNVMRKAGKEPKEFRVVHRGACRGNKPSVLNPQNDTLQNGTNANLN